MKLTESLHEVYEPDWYGREDVKMVGEVRPGCSTQEAWGRGGAASARLPPRPLPQPVPDPPRAPTSQPKP